MINGLLPQFTRLGGAALEPEPAQDEPASPESSPSPEEAESFVDLRKRLPLAPLRALDTPSRTPTPTPAPAAPVATQTPAPTPLPAPAATYVGEPAVDPAWLQQREAALSAVRSDYEAARNAARATVGGTGWTNAQTYTDESGQRLTLSGRPAVFVADPAAPPEVIGWDESGPLTRPAGHWFEFDEEAFAADYRARGGAPLAALAELYDTDTARLLAQHPEIWTLATRDHALNAGPPQPGRAMGDAAQLGMLDLYLADSQLRALIDAYGGGPVEPATSALAREQVRLYGQQRYEQLTRLDRAMQSVRDQYSRAMTEARANGGPGWVDLPRTITIADEGGGTRAEPIWLRDESGIVLGADGRPQALTERCFDPDRFTAWYLQQDGLAQQAFASFYGQSHTSFGTDESGQRVAGTITFDNPAWMASDIGGGRMIHRELVSIDLNRPPRLNNDRAVGFDLDAGWATANSNIHQHRDWFETAVKIVLVAGITYATAGLGSYVAGATTAAASGAGASAGVAAALGAAAGAATMGAVTSMASGIVNGNFSLKNVLRGALAGAITGGLGGSFGPLDSIGGVLGRATLQGGIQALLGGRFEEGALSSLASSLAQLTGQQLEQGISQAVADQSMSAGEAFAARGFARVLTSAITAAGNPDDPNYAFANAFLGDTLRAAMPEAEPLPSATFVDTMQPTQGEGSWSEQDYRNGADVQSDQATGPMIEPEAPEPAATAPTRLDENGSHLDEPGVAAAPTPAPTQDPAPPDESTAAQPSTADEAPADQQAAIGARRELDWSRRDDSGQVVERALYVGDEETFRYSSDSAGQYTVTVGANNALVRDAAGQLQLVSWAEAQRRDDYTVLVPPGQTLVSNGVQGVVLPQGSSGDTLRLASALTLLAVPAGAGEIGFGAAAGAAAELAAAARALGVLGLALYSAPLGGGETVVPIRDDLRVVKPASDVIMGYVEVRNASGQWLRLDGGQYDPAQVARLADTLQSAALTPEELRTVQAPLIYVPTPPQDTSPPPVVADRPDTSLPGYEVPDIPAPWIETLPAADPPSAEDLLIDKTNSKILGDKMREAGINPPGEGYEPHHVVPTGAGQGTEMDAVRAKLANLGIDLNDPVNGVWLPGPSASVDAPEAYHRTLNNDAYNKAIIDLFRDVSTANDAVDVLFNIAARLRSGNFPGVRPRP